MRMRQTLKWRKMYFPPIGRLFFITDFAPFYRIHSNCGWRVNSATNTVCNCRHTGWRPNSTAVPIPAWAICMYKIKSMRQTSARCAWIGRYTLEAVVAIAFVAVYRWLNTSSAVRLTAEMHPYTMPRRGQSQKCTDSDPGISIENKNYIFDHLTDCSRTHLNHWGPIDVWIEEDGHRFMRND